ncbi:Transcription factor [Conoideocrella luteorostrata]|uniref:Transcription factor n=1 Tax=Conoideocrella luteorostrata TaxID=1105319 RepID=A0AAJ0CN09_9HYPO|nr:Transcription factor [Conoideocrella luteorostrata]
MDKQTKAAERTKAERADKVDAKDRAKNNGGSTFNSKSPKKRRKVNHACVYCRRSHMTCDLERPCTRCIKRNIGHLCHDEPRDADNTKKLKNGKAPSSSVDESDAQSQTPSDVVRSSISSTMGPPPFDGMRQRSASGFGAGGVLGQGNTMSLVTPGSGSGLQGNGPSNSGTGNANQFSGISDAWLTVQNFNDMNSYNPNYMIAPHVTHEFNLLNDLLHNGLLDDSNLNGDESQELTALGQPGQSDVLAGFGGNAGQSSGGPVPSTGRRGTLMPPPPKDGNGSQRKANSASDKTREYYLQAADPSGNDNAEERMARVLHAKYDAGLLKPFNYINGYSRLGKYLEGHIATSSKQKILRTINQFRPKFREKAQGLTDMQLIIVEMWFEKQLMDYDRVFASMAVPACCWRRTGEIFRGNKEMAELINVPVDQLRDGKIALHEILTEESMVRYWEEFGTIAFDPAHDTLLTACSLKNPSDTSDHPVVKCCFSFTIRRDDHKLPALIVGNFLPHDPAPN